MNKIERFDQDTSTNPKSRGVDYSHLMVESAEEALVKEEKWPKAAPAAVLLRQKWFRLYTGTPLCTLDATGGAPRFTPKGIMESPRCLIVQHLRSGYLDAEGDAPQLTSKEIRPEARYARHPADAFRTRSPACREGPRQGLPRLWAAPGRPDRP